MSRRRERKLPRALTASVLLHAALLCFVLWRGPVKPGEGRAPKPIEMQIVMVEPVVAPAPPTPAPPPPPKTPTRSPRAESRGAPSKPSQPEVAAAPTAPAGPSAPTAEAADSPRGSSPFLVPRVGSVLPELGYGEESEAQGHTLKNGPGEEPDKLAVREYTEERTKVKLDDDLGEMVAAQQRKNGLVDPYFTHLAADLQQKFVGAKVKLTPKTSAETFKQEVVDTYVQPAERFAKTGNPMADPEQARQFNESSFGRTLERGGTQLGDAHDQRTLEGGMQSMAFTAVIKDSAQRPRLKTLMMLRQDGDGALAEASFIEKSGDDQFDEFVLHLTRQVVRDQGDTSEVGGSPSAWGWSSVWQFTWEPPQVKVKLLRVLKAKPQVHQAQ
jgi:hypothetical protein